MGDSKPSPQRDREKRASRDEFPRFSAPSCGLLLRQFWPFGGQRLKTTEQPLFEGTESNERPKTPSKLSSLLQLKHSRSYREKSEGGPEPATPNREKLIDFATDPAFASAPTTPAVAAQSPMPVSVSPLTTAVVAPPPQDMEVDAPLLALPPMVQEKEKESVVPVEASVAPIVSTPSRAVDCAAAKGPGARAEQDVLLVLSDVKSDAVESMEEDERQEEEVVVEKQETAGFVFSDNSMEERKDDGGGGGAAMSGVMEVLDYGGVEEEQPTPSHPVASTPAPPTASLGDCLSALSSPSFLDYPQHQPEILASAIRHVREGGADLDVLHAVYDATPSDVLASLLLEGGSLPPSSPALPPFLSLLAAFCSEPELAASRKLFGAIPLLATVLKAPSSASSASLDDAYDSLSHIASSSPSGSAAIKAEGLIAPCASELAARPDESSRVHPLHLLSALLPLSLPLADLQGYQPELQAAVPHLAADFRSCEDAITRLRIARILKCILAAEGGSPVLSSLSEEAASVTGAEPAWVVDIREGLVGVLTASAQPGGQGVVAHTRLLSLSLCSAVTESLGPSWLVRPIATEIPSDGPRGRNSIVNGDASSDNGSSIGSFGAGSFSSMSDGQEEKETPISLLLILLDSLKQSLPVSLSELATLTLLDEDEEDEEQEEKDAEKEEEEQEEGGGEEKYTADAAWAALGGHLDRPALGGAGPLGEGGGLQRAGEGGLSSAGALGGGGGGLMRAGGGGGGLGGAGSLGGASGLMSLGGGEEGEESKELSKTEGKKKKTKKGGKRKGASSGGGGGLVRTGGGLGGKGAGVSLESMKSVVATSEDWRSVVNDIVWEPPKDDHEGDNLMMLQEEEEEEEGLPEEVREARMEVEVGLGFLERVITTGGLGARAVKGVLLPAPAASTGGLDAAAGGGGGLQRAGGASGGLSRAGGGGGGGLSKAAGLEAPPALGGLQKAGGGGGLSRAGGGGLSRAGGGGGGLSRGGGGGLARASKGGGEEGQAAGTNSGSPAAAGGAAKPKAEAAPSVLILSLPPGAIRLATAYMDELFKDTLEFLELAKEQEVYADDGILSAVKFVGRYLTEAPWSHRRRVARLLPFVLSVRAEDEDIALQCVSFLLPALVQLTSEPAGCNSLLKRGCHKNLITFAVETSRTNMMGQLRAGPDAQAQMMDVADSMLNLFAARKSIKTPIDPHEFIPLLASMAAWSSVKGTDPKVTYKTLAMAACVNSSILNLSNEDIIKKRLDLATYKKLPKSLEVIVKFLEFGHRNSASFSSETEIRELWDITVQSCTESLPVWPQLKRAMVKSEYWGKVSRGKAVTQERLVQVCKDEKLRGLLATVAFSP